MPKLRSNDPRNLLFTGKDPAEQMRYVDSLSLLGEPDNDPFTGIGKSKGVPLRLVLMN